MAWIGLFTLSGGHLFSIYDGCRAEGIELVDVRHEQTAAFAAEGWAKVTRSLGVCALTAGPGVTNGVSAMASASQNSSPMLVLGGRAPELRWGQGSLQEIDHVPIVSPVCKLAATARATQEIPKLVDDAMSTALAPRSGPAFLDFPLDVVFGEAPDPGPSAGLPDPVSGPLRGLGPFGGRTGGRPAVGGRAPGDHGWNGPLLGARRGGAAGADRGAPDPRVSNGLARGCVPADHELFFSRARGTA